MRTTQGFADQYPRAAGLGWDGWAARTAVSKSESERLRRDFLSAPTAVRDAFEIQDVEGDIHFAWPCLVFRALKV